MINVSLSIGPGVVVSLVQLQTQTDKSREMENNEQISKRVVFRTVNGGSSFWSERLRV